ncbi:MAG: C39 family peptidase [Dehalococcoidales bacterium]
MHKIRNVFIVLLVVIILGTMFSTTVVSAAGASTSTQSDIQLAQQSGQEYISQFGIKICSNWENAELANGTACYDLQNNIIGYMFSILKGGSYEGYIVVGNSLYNFETLESVSGAPLPSITGAEAQAIFSAAGDQVDNIQPKLAYLGYRRYYSVFDSGTKQLAINMATKNVVDVSTLVSSLATPSQYQQNLKDNQTALMQSIQPDYQMPNPLNVPCDNGQTAYGANNCGPTTGAMISEYYNANSFPNLPVWSTDEYELYYTMNCNNWFPYIWGGTAPWNFGPGWTQNAVNNGYNNFSTDWCLNRQFGAIETEIDSLRPMGVMFSYDDYANWHWCVVKGYIAYDDNIIMNDPNGGFQATCNWDSNQADAVITRIRF